jgi:hypothetical protein
MLQPEPYLAPAVEALSHQIICVRQQQYLQKARDLILSAAAKLQEPLQVGISVCVDQQYCSRLVSEQLQEWECQDPPCGCISDGSMLASGMYCISAHMPSLVDLVEKTLKDAMSCADTAIADALLRAISKIALMLRILPDRQQVQQVCNTAIFC